MTGYMRDVIERRDHRKDDLVRTLRMAFVASSCTGPCVVGNITKIDLDETKGGLEAN